MPPPRRLAGRGRPSGPAPLPRRALLEPAASGVRKSAVAPLHRRPRPRRAWRQSNRPDLHGRRVRELSLQRDPCGRAFQQRGVGSGGRWPRALRSTADGGGQVRASRQPAASRGVRELPGVPDRRNAADLPAAGAAGSRRPGVRVLPPGACRHRRSGPASQASLRAWRAIRDRLGRSLRLLPPQPADHLHGPAHAADAARRASPRGEGGCLVENPLTRSPLPGGEGRVHQLRGRLLPLLPVSSETFSITFSTSSPIWSRFD